MAQRLIIKEIFHYGQKRLGIYFDYDKTIIKAIRTIAGCRWSNTKKCWHVQPGADLSSLLEFDFTLEKTTNERIRKPKEDQEKKEVKIKRKDTSKEIEVAVNKMETYMVYRRYAAITVKSYISMIRTFLYRMKIEKPSLITLDDLKEYIENQRNEHAVSKSWQSILISAIKLFHRSNDLEMFNVSKVERPKGGRKLPKTLSEEEVLKILKATKNQKHYCLLSVIYSAGLRIGETLSLELEHVSFSDSIIYIRSGKGDKDRCVPLSQKAKAIIRRYCAAYNPIKYLFEGQVKGQKYSSRSAQQVLKQSVKFSGIKKHVTLHTLRHSYATHLLERGVGLRYIQDILGHKSPKTTMLYTHVSGKKLREVKSPLDDMDL